MSPCTTSKCNDSSERTRVKTNIWETTVWVVLSAFCRAAGGTRKAHIHRRDGAGRNEEGQAKARWFQGLQET